MTDSVARILSEVEQLSGDERAEVAYAVLRLLGPEHDAEGDAFEAELARRVDEIQSGQAVGRPADEVFARLLGRRA
jgi:putative addiction module component (TIGR02574 family)